MAVTVSPEFLEFIRDRVSGNAAYAIAVRDGNEYIRSITETKHTTSDTVAVVQWYVYLDDVDAEGTITEARLVDANGDRLVTSDAQIVSAGSGALLLFEVTIKLEVTA